MCFSFDLGYIWLRDFFFSSTKLCSDSSLHQALTSESHFSSPRLLIAHICYPSSAATVGGVCQLGTPPQGRPLIAAFRLILINGTELLHFILVVYFKKKSPQASLWASAQRHLHTAVINSVLKRRATEHCDQLLLQTATRVLRQSWHPLQYVLAVSWAAPQNSLSQAKKKNTFDPHEDTIAKV